LHDVDRDHIDKVAANHLQEEFANIINKLPYDQVTKDQIILDIRTHYPHGTNIEPQTLIQKYLISIDELSGLMFAYSRMR
jgi:predicted hydrolase (HD superfamily)